MGMIHLEALPGTPANFAPISEIVSKAVEEARIYVKHGVVRRLGVCELA